MNCSKEQNHLELGGRRPKQILSLSLSQKKKKKKKKKKDAKETVEMSGPFFLRWITADPSPWGNFTPPTKH